MKKSIVTLISMVFILVSILVAGCAQPALAAAPATPVAASTETTPAVPETVSQTNGASSAVAEAATASVATVTTMPTVALPAATPAPATYPNAGLLVSTKWLNDHLAEPNLVIIDTRKNSDFEAGHIKNAINLVPSSFDGVSISVPTDKTALLDSKDLANMLGQLWISDKSKIVVYGVNVDTGAGRFFWLLEYLGHNDAHVLDGGFEKWKSAGLPISTERTVKDPKTFVSSVNAASLATKSGVLSSHSSTNFVLVDARNATDYNTKRDPHAVNILMADYLNADGTVKSYSDLRALLDAKGITPDKTVITYCPTGYRAAQAYFIYRLMGNNVADYDGSWAEWNADSSMPIEP